MAQALAGYEYSGKKYKDSQILYFGLGTRLGTAFLETDKNGDVIRFRDFHIQQDPQILKSSFLNNETRKIFRIKRYILEYLPGPWKVAEFKFLYKERGILFAIWWAICEVLGHVIIPGVFFHLFGRYIAILSLAIPWQIGLYPLYFHPFVSGGLKKIASKMKERIRIVKRLSNNPVLKPIKEHPWESERVFNCGTVKIKDKIYVFYRAIGEDKVNRIGLAVFSSDGKRLIERLPYPIYEMKGGEFPLAEKFNYPYSLYGVEDPRVSIIGDEIYMVYSAWNGKVTHVALSAIRVEDFLKRDWSKWKRYGLLNIGSLKKGEDDRDACLYPEKINGKYVLIHRVNPNILISYSPDLKSWSEYKVLMRPRKNMWDSEKIGIAAPPVKTKFGWLNTYHGVKVENGKKVYRMGIFITDLNDPERIIYRSEKPIMEPYEVYEKEKGFVTKAGIYPEVVFISGVVPLDKNSNEILEGDDEILLYYGTGDRTVCVAKVKISDIVPEEVRKNVKGIRGTIGKGKSLRKVKGLNAKQVNEEGMRLLGEKIKESIGKTVPPLREVGRGNQFVVYSSPEIDYVVKVLRRGFGPFSYFDRKVALDGYRLAKEKFSDRTGIIEITDAEKVGLKSKYPVIIQRKFDPLSQEIKKLAEQGRIDEAKLLIKEYFDLLNEMKKRGIYDIDRVPLSACGYDKKNKKVVLMDCGMLTDKTRTLPIILMKFAYLLYNILPSKITNPVQEIGITNSEIEKELSDYYVSILVKSKVEEEIKAERISRNREILKRLGIDNPDAYPDILSSSKDLEDMARFLEEEIGIPVKKYPPLLNYEKGRLRFVKDFCLRYGIPINLSTIRFNNRRLVKRVLWENCRRLLKNPNDQQAQGRLDALSREFPILFLKEYFSLISKEGGYHFVNEYMMRKMIFYFTYEREDIRGLALKNLLEMARIMGKGREKRDEEIEGIINKYLIYDEGYYDATGWAGGRVIKREPHLVVTSLEAIREIVKDEGIDVLSYSLLQEILKICRKDAEVFIKEQFSEIFNSVPDVRIINFWIKRMVENGVSREDVIWELKSIKEAYKKEIDNLVCEEDKVEEVLKIIKEGNIYERENISFEIREWLEWIDDIVLETGKTIDEIREEIEEAKERYRSRKEKLTYKILQKASDLVERMRSSRSGKMVSAIIPVIFAAGVASIIIASTIFGSFTAPNKEPVGKDKVKPVEPIPSLDNLSDRTVKALYDEFGFRDKDGDRLIERQPIWQFWQYWSSEEGYNEKYDFDRNGVIDLNEVFKIYTQEDRVGEDQVIKSLIEDIRGDNFTHRESATYVLNIIPGGRERLEEVLLEDIRSSNDINRVRETIDLIQNLPDANSILIKAVDLEMSKEKKAEILMNLRENGISSDESSHIVNILLDPKEDFSLRVLSAKILIENLEDKEVNEIFSRIDKGSQISADLNDRGRILVELAKDDSYRVKEFLAKNDYSFIDETEFTDEIILRILSEDGDWRIRKAVAENENTATDVIEKLIQDENEEVFKAAVKNKNAPLNIEKIERIARVN
ncbi:MAG: hypothetical protein DRI22_01265, partial [Caldiserica bacterium]